MSPSRHSLAVANYASHVRCYRFTSEIISSGITRATPELHSHTFGVLRLPSRSLCSLSWWNSTLVPSRRKKKELTLIVLLEFTIVWLHNISEKKEENGAYIRGNDRDFGDGDLKLLRGNEMMIKASSMTAFLF